MYGQHQKASPRCKPKPISDCQNLSVPSDCPLGRRMAPSKALLGPPEIYNPKPADAVQFSGNTGNWFVDIVEKNFNSTTLPPNPQPNPCLDLFFSVVPNTPAGSLTHSLELAWAHNPLTTLKLICNLRGIRGTGKSDKEGYYTAALWLHNHHPKTIACNIGPMAEFGYFKDLPEILYRLLEGSDVRKKAKELWLARKRGNTGGYRGGRGGRGGYRGRGGHHIEIANPIWRPFSSFSKKKKLKKNTYISRKSKEARALVLLRRAQFEKKNASKLREEKKVIMAKKAVARYGRDPDYRFLFERISDFFADRLKADLELLNTGKLKEISLAAKWCPSLNSSFDKSTLICESIARKVFPRESYPEYEGVEDAHYAYRVRDRLRKQVLVPLRKALELPEVYIGANQWGAIPYNRVASIAMNYYKEKFMKHDTERFEDYLEKVKSGKASIAAGALLPHQIIGSLDDGDAGQVAELQWKRLVNDFSKKGKLKNCLAMCDVSSSMEGIAMEVAVALGVLVSELSEEPWSGKLITFSADPKLQKVAGEDLRSKIDFVMDMEFGKNTDFQKVFDLILQVAVNVNLEEDQMIKRIFVFSGMEFDQASKNHWETDYQAITRKFTAKGYGSCVPEIVFWNLKDSRATPVPGNQPGVALVSGYSKNLMTIFLEDNGDLTPETVMEAAIAGNEYKNLEVLD